MAWPDLVAAARFDKQTSRWRRWGFGVLYAFWVAFSCLAVVYGRLVYQLLGSGSANAFLQSWALGIGAGQLANAQAFLTTCIETVLVLTVMDALWLLPNNRWLEMQLDYASVAATRFNTPNVGLRQYVFASLVHGKAIAL